MKKKKGLPRLFEIAGEKKGLLILAGVLSALSACCMLIPYLAVYQVLNNLLENAGEINNVDKEYLTDWGWIAFAGLIGGLLLLYGALMSSHMGRFPYPLRTAGQAVRTYRKTASRLSEQQFYRSDQKSA